MARRRAVSKKQEWIESDLNEQVSNESIDDTPCNVRVVCKSATICLLSLYVAVPIVLYAFPQIIEQVVFMNLQHKSGEADSLSRPFLEYELHGVGNFFVNCDGEHLGVWHILPKEKLSYYSHESSVQRQSYDDLLQDAKDIIIYHHGNGMSRATGAGHHRSQLYKVLQSAGYHVIAFDYRGFGDSTGWPSEEGLVRDSLCIFRWVKERVPQAVQVSFWGHSLGAAIATISAGKVLEDCHEQNTCAGINSLIVEGGYEDLAQAAEESFPASVFNAAYPRWLFQRILKTAFEAIHIEMKVGDSMAKVRCRVLILHAEDDSDILCRHGDELFEICKETKDLKNSVKYVKFKAHNKYGHTGIVKAPNLPEILKSFLDGNNQGIEAVVM